LIELINEVAEEVRSQDVEVRAVGVGVPGTPDIEGGVISFLTNLPGRWRGVPLQKLLEDGTGLPSAMINDVRAITLGEYVFGAGKGSHTMACFAIGTGIGGGVVINGQFHLGIGGTAGEFGHMVVEKDGLPCGCGGRGCLELYTSGPAIASMGVREVMQGHTTRIGELVGYDLNRISAEVVVDAAREGDMIALDILQRAGTYLGMAVSSVITTISPDRVIFTGGVSQAGELLFSHVRQFVKEHVHVVPIEKVDFRQAALGDQGGLVGAALWAQRRCEGWLEKETRGVLA
jgi:glucokinase